jgi:hypothetical protein
VVAIARLLILIVNDCDVVDAPVESVTLTVKVNRPNVVGVPEIVTVLVVLAPSANPGGRLPEATDHAKFGTPPVRDTVALYAPPVPPEGNDVVVILGAGCTVMESVADWLG